MSSQPIEESPPRIVGGVRPRGGWRRFALLLKRLAAAVVLGVATLFMLKTEADQHWSDPPVVAVIIAYDQAAHPDEPND
jgi:hypothetical protein